MAALINSEESTATFIVIPSGSFSSSFGTNSLTPFAIAKVFPVDCFTTPNPIASLPLILTILRFSKGPGIAYPTSFNLTKYPS